MCAASQKMRSCHVHHLSAAAAPCRLAAARLSSLRPPPALVPSASRATVLLVAPISFASTSRHHSAHRCTAQHSPADAACRATRSPCLTSHAPREPEPSTTYSRQVATPPADFLPDDAVQAAIINLLSQQLAPAPPHQSSSSTSADSQLLKTRPKPPFPVGASLHVKFNCDFLQLRLRA